jgi:protocatechuate 3,4-dioxygenase alpha subunit
MAAITVAVKTQAPMQNARASDGWQPLKKVAVTLKPSNLDVSWGRTMFGRRPHIEVAIFARGLLKQLFTRIYFANEPSNAEDPALALVPEDRRQTLMARSDHGRPGHWQFDIHLQGEKETVFFDV